MQSNYKKTINKESLKQNISPFNGVNEVPYGLAVRIPGFHPGGPGSTPGMGTCTFRCVCCGDAIKRSFPLVSCNVYILHSHHNLQKLFWVICKISEIIGGHEICNYTTIKQ